MALAKRIIPCLDVDNGRVVKGVNFVGLRDAGDPVEIARRYDAQGADELGDQAAEQRLLEEDEEHQQADSAGEQPEAQLGAAHLTEGEEHRSSAWLHRR